MSALLIDGVPIECINQAAIHYYVPAVLIISVLATENGRVGEANPNSNGTVDYGPMQINSSWLDRIRPFGYTAYDLQYNPCINVEVGAWILAQSIASQNQLWEGVGDYHSHTPEENEKYQYKVNQVYQLLYQYLYQAPQK